MKRVVGILVVLVILVAGWAGSGMAQMAAPGVNVYDASGDFIGGYYTIQDGIDACPSGGTVSVSAGTYMEAVYVNKGINLVGVNMPVIDASGLGTNTSTATVTFDMLITADASISGFKITGAKGGNGITCKAVSNPSIINNTITGNKQSGIYCQSSCPSISNNTITGNSSYGINCNNSSPSISNNTITGNSNYGINCQNSSPSISNNTITRNSSGGIYCSSSFPSINNNTITGNSSYGIYCYSSSPSISNNTITGNGSGGIYCYSSSPSISNNTITVNSSYGINCESSSPSISNNTITGNSNYGINCQNSSPSISNNMIVGNSSYGIYCSSSNSSITNNTIRWHTYGIYQYQPYNSYLKIYNNIITENGKCGIYQGSSCKINYNCVYNNGVNDSGNYYSCIPGPNDISLDPQFISRSDCRLQSSSPCINSGLNTASNTTTKDIDGNQRIVNGTIDMGAYEFQGAATTPVAGPILSITKSVDKNSASPGSILTYTIRYKNISADSLTDVNITDKVPAYTTYEQNSASNGGSFTNGKLLWKIGSLSSGAEGVVTFRARINENTPATTISNNAAINCTEATGNLPSNFAYTIVNKAAQTKITHTLIKFWSMPGSDIKIEANTSNSANAVLYYKTGETAPVLVSMSGICSNAGYVCTGVIPANAVTHKGVKYWIEADGATTPVYSVTVGYPVLLVHGLNSNTAGSWQKSSCNFVDRIGQFATVFTIDLAPANTPANGRINISAEKLSQKIDSIKQQTNASQVDIVGYSMGGLVSRWYTRFIDRKSVHKLIMIGTPNHGSELLGDYCYSQAAPLGAINLGIKAAVEKQLNGPPGPAGLQMIPNSIFLNQLNYDFLSEPLDNQLRNPHLKLTPGIKYYTIAGTNGFTGLASCLSSLLEGDDDGVVRVDSVKLDTVTNTPVPYNHTELTGTENVCNIVSKILQDIPLPQQAPPLTSPSPEAGISTSVQHMPLIYGTISQSETKAHNIPIDSNITEISFLSGWEGGDIGLTLTAPDGTSITPSPAVGSITYFKETTVNVEGYTIKNPAAGTWTVNVTGSNVSGIGTYSVEMLAQSTLILSLTTDKNVYDPNQPIHITAMLANNNLPVTGASVTARVITPTNAEDILLYDDGTHEDSQANDGTYTNTYANTSMSGNYGVVATAVGSINNQPFVRQANTIIYVEQFPDLTIATSSITFSNNAPAQNETITVSATINNIGDIAATNTTVLFYDGMPSESGVLFGTTTVENIPKGGSAVASAKWTATYGSHTIYVAISPYNSFLEKDYNNNSAARQVVVAGADLSISAADISFSPISPKSGEMATITTVVYNTGTLKADNVVIRFSIGTGTEIGSQTITSIPANGSQSVQIGWDTAGYTGIATIYTQIDPQNKILEVDENNNTASGQVYIQGTDTSSPTIGINPIGQQTLSGYVEITAVADDNVGITRVEFYIDNVLKYTDITEPYSYSWDTTKGSNTSHAVKAIAYDPSGLTGEASMTVIVDNSAPLETIPPVFSVAVSPDPAKSGTISILVSANEKLAGVPTIALKDSGNGIIAAELVLNANPSFRYQATITSATAQGTAAVNVSGTDLAGNPGSGTADFQVAAPLPVPAFGTLSVISSPAGAAILIDGVNKGITPADVTLQSGSYTLSLTLAHYSTYTTPFTIGTETITHITALLTATISTHLKITPTVKNIIKGEEFTANIEIADVSDMITGQLHLSFDPAVLELLEIGTGTFPETGNVVRQCDNTTGKMSYFVGLITGSATGSGVICSLKFKAKANGSSSVVFDFDEANNRLTRLKDAGGNNIPFNKEEAVYYVFTGISGIKIKPQDVTVMADESIAYQCIAICDNGMEMDVTGLTTFTADSGGSFTLHSLLAKYSGTYTLQGEYAGLKGTTSVGILPGTPSSVVCVSGNNQSGSCGTALNEAFVVKVMDKYDNLCQGAGVNWDILSTPPGAAGYSLYSNETATNNQGTASSLLTLGTEPPGTYTVQAVLAVATASSYSFTANSLRRFGRIAGVCLLDLGEGNCGTSSGILVSISENGSTTMTDSKSWFTFGDMTPGTYTLKFDSRGAASRVVSNVHISRTQFEQTTHIGTITLLAGDITNDGRINLMDWTGFADAFFKQEGSSNWEELKQADFNHDGRVNDEDFIVFRSNFGRQTEGIVMKSPGRDKAMPCLYEQTGSVELSLEWVNVNELHVGDIVYLKVYICNAAGMLGAEVHLSYDPKVLEVVNTTMPAGSSRRFLATDAVRIQNGDYFSGDVWELMNRVDAAAGRIDYAVGVLSPEQTRDEGILAIVPFRIKSAGVSSGVDFNFKEQENRQTLVIQRSYVGVEGKVVDTIPDIRSEGVVITVPQQAFTPNDIRVYPNPVDATGGREVIFDHLPQGRQITLRIYNLAGELVFEGCGASEIRWGLRNKDGESTASGVYVYCLLDGTGVIKQGKVGVVR